MKTTDAIKLLKSAIMDLEKLPSDQDVDFFVSNRTGYQDDCLAHDVELEVDQQDGHNFITFIFKQ